MTLEQNINHTLHVNRLWYFQRHVHGNMSMIVRSEQ